MKFTHKIIILYLICLALAFIMNGCHASEVWKITAYCSCSKCCGKADGITASGKVAEKGICALNWLPFGALVRIEGLGTFKVMDRGARSLFGSRTNHIKHIDIWFPTHAEARKFGVQYKNVEVL